MTRSLWSFIMENLGWVSTPVTIFVLQFLVGGIPHLPQIFMYAGFILSAIYLFLDKSFKIDNLWLAFLVYLPLTIILARPDPVFMSPIRYALFATLLLSASSLVGTERARKFRRQCLNLIGIFSTIIAVGSFPCYFLGINLFEDRYDEGFYTDYVEQVGHFSGLTTHSMLLGPLAGFAMVFLFYYAVTKKKKILWPLIIACAGSALFAASRGAIIAAVGGFVTVMYFTSTTRSVFMRRITRLAIILVLTLPLWSGALDRVLDKQEARTEAGGAFDSRTGKIEARIDEFTKSPIYGVGFSAIDTNGQDHYNMLTGTIEPGSSWFAILSQTGLIGFIIVILLFKRSYIFSRDSLDPYKIPLLGMLVFFSIHMLVEGYIFAGGNPITFIVWLVVGNCYDLKFTKI